MKRGEVVEVDWQYTDMSSSKVRPAVVVQADFLNGLIDDTILVQVTSTRHSIPGTEVLLDPAVETAAGISRICFASCANILTRDQGLVLRRTGYVSAAAMDRIAASLKAVLELP